VKYEARLKGPNITPGYWREPKLTADACDADGYYKLGDALRFDDPRRDQDAGRQQLRLRRAHGPRYPLAMSELLPDEPEWP